MRRPADPRRRPWRVRRSVTAAGSVTSALACALAVSVLATALTGCARPDEPPPVHPSLTGVPASPAPAGWRYVFADEFDGPALDLDKWAHCYPWGACTNAANDESQWYQPGNVEVADGTLRIAARRQTVVPTPDGESRSYEWTSGLINTHASFRFQYGRVEIRAKLPGGQAVWPAFWLLSADLDFPPEIDVFELNGGKTDTVTSTLHDTEGGKQHRPAATTDWTAGWHTWRLDWAPDELTVFIDDIEIGTFTRHVPSESMYLLVNLAVGGSFVGRPDESTPDGATLLVDWIRAFERDDG